MNLIFNVYFFRCRILKIKPAIKAEDRLFAITDEFTHFDNDRENVVEMDIGTDPSCEKRPLRSSRINHPLVPSLIRRGYRGGQDQVFKSLGILVNSSYHRIDFNIFKPYFPSWQQS